MARVWQGELGKAWTKLLVVLLLGSAAAHAQELFLSNSSWPSYNGSPDGQRFALPDQITPDNAASLVELCRVKIEDSGSFQTALLQIGELIYLTTPHDTVAVDATACSVRWRNTYTPEQADVFPVNRGVAYANGRLFRGTPDGRLLAIDAATGKTVWQHQIGDPAQGDFFSAAPVAWQGLLILGAAGGDWGIRGRVMAYEQDTGREVWRFYTIPRGKERGAETWKDPRTTQSGGGGTWSTYTVDASSGEVFIPVGNPAPDLSPKHRPGENLFTDSVVVLDARTGGLKWWHQLAANDGHDLDIGAAPMLFWDRKGRAMLAIAGKDGYLRVVDRETHKELFKTVITTIENEGLPPTPEGIHACPGPFGGTEWNGPAFDTQSKAIIVGAVDWCATLHSAKVEYVPGNVYLGGTWELDKEAHGWVNAIDSQTGAMLWRYRSDGALVAGITPTAGGVTFTGDMLGNFLVLDSRTGKLLLKTATGGAIAGGVITYAKGGTQYVAVTSGNVSRVTFGNQGSSGKPSLIIYTLGTGNAASSEPVTAVAAQTVATGPTSGKTLYEGNCAACHGAKGEGALGPSLKGISARMDLDKTKAWIRNPSTKMPKLYPSPLNDQAVADIAAYLQKF